MQHLHHHHPLSTSTSHPSPFSSRRRHQPASLQASQPAKLGLLTLTRVGNRHLRSITERGCTVRECGPSSHLSTHAFNSSLPPLHPLPSIHPPSLLPLFDSGRTQSYNGASCQCPTSLLLLLLLLLHYSVFWILSCRKSFSFTVLICWQPVGTHTGSRTERNLGCTDLLLLIQRKKNHIPTSVGAKPAFCMFIEY